MAYQKAPADHTEFGGGPGIMDTEARKDRAFRGDQQHIPITEVYATNPADPNSDPTSVPLERERNPSLLVPPFDPYATT